MSHTKEQEAPPPATYSIKTFCQTHNVSESQYFILRKAGLGPAEMKIGRRRIISVESAADWRRERERDARKGRARP
jgi:hypothetical protein